MNVGGQQDGEGGENQKTKLVCALKESEGKEKAWKGKEKRNEKELEIGFSPIFYQKENGEKSLKKTLKESTLIWLLN